MCVVNFTYGFGSSKLGHIIENFNNLTFINTLLISQVKIMSFDSHMNQIVVFFNTCILSYPINFPINEVTEMKLELEGRKKFFIHYFLLFK